MLCVYYKITPLTPVSNYLLCHTIIMLGLSCVDKVSLVVWAPIKKQKWGIWKFYGNLTNQQDDGCFSGLSVGVLACHGDRNPVDAHLPRFHSGAAASAGYWKTGLSGFSLTRDITFLVCFCLPSTGIAYIYSRPAANCRTTLNWGTGQVWQSSTSSKEGGGGSSDMVPWPPEMKLGRDG